MVALATLLAGTVALIGTPTPSAAAQTPAGYSQAVTQICAGSPLFEGSHQIGTRAGATDLAQNIRLTGGLRLSRVDAVPKPVGTAKLAARWIAIERQLVETYASSYLQIWYAIESADAPGNHAKLPALISTLISRPDRLQGQAAALAQQLNVPDCTGGQPSHPPTNGSDRFGTLSRRLSG